ncbi:MAG: hypothetical protein N4A44_03985 [Alphaproteobacteria bacterium]|jgi:hypothetical protein|nr:hypothetical protein [Alphaproteobacteria bacterium]
MYTENNITEEVTKKLLPDELEKVLNFLNEKGYRAEFITPFIEELFRDENVWTLRIQNIHILKRESFKISDLKDLDGIKPELCSEKNFRDEGTGIFNILPLTKKDEVLELVPSFKKEFYKTKNLIGLHFPAEVKYFRTENFFIFDRQLPKKMIDN